MVSRQHVTALYPRAPSAHVEAFSDRSGRLLSDFEIDRNENRFYFFLAQIGHESGGLTVTEENMHYRAERICEVWPTRFANPAAARPFERNPSKLANRVYCDRMGNGPEASGDGFKFRGRGYIQITGRDGYRNVGRIAALDLEDDPDKAAAPEHALKTACSFWEWKGLNPICDTGDFIKVTRRINGGTVGIADRKAWLDKVRRTFADPLSAATQPDAAEVIAIQRALQKKGYKELGAADGVVGQRTIAAIQRFRSEHGLPPGLIDNALRRALDL